MTALIDTGFMLAVLSHNDPRHLACRAVVEAEPILTVDQRDFRMFRPKHIPTFEILP